MHCRQLNYTAKTIVKTLGSNMATLNANRKVQDKLCLKGLSFKLNSKAKPLKKELAIGAPSCNISNYTTAKDVPKTSTSSMTFLKARDLKMQNFNLKDEVWKMQGLGDNIIDKNVKPRNLKIDKVKSIHYFHSNAAPMLNGLQSDMKHLPTSVFLSNTIEYTKLKKNYIIGLMSKAIVEEIYLLKKSMPRYMNLIHG